jgi:hypothetical protein
MIKVVFYSQMIERKEIRFIKINLMSCDAISLNWYIIQTGPKATRDMQLSEKWWTTSATMRQVTNVDTLSGLWNNEGQFCIWHILQQCVIDRQNKQQIRTFYFMIEVNHISVHSKLINLSLLVYIAKSL